MKNGHSSKLNQYLKTKQLLKSNPPRFYLLEEQSTQTSPDVFEDRTLSVKKKQLRR